jgi:hypothetical protein
MKLMTILCLLLFNAFAVDFNYLSSTMNPTMDRIADKTQMAMDQADLAPFEAVYKMSYVAPGTNPKTLIEEILYSLYIDDQSAYLAQTDPQSLKRIAKLLNYRNVSGDRNILRALKIVETELRALNNDPDLLLFSLESRGYGSFGEANGFAIVDRTNNELIIVQSGYAE